MSIAAVDARPFRLNHLRPAQPPAERPLLQLRSMQEGKNKILFVSSDRTDLSKTGGLADVSAALPRALAALPDVRVLIPGYAQIMRCCLPIRIVGSVSGHADLPAARI